MAYLRLLVNPADIAAFLRIVNVPRREIGPSTLEKLSRYTAQRQTAIFYAADELGFQQQLKERQKYNLNRFLEALWPHMKAFADLQGEAVLIQIRQLIEDVRYEDWLLQEATSVKQGEKRLANLQSFYDWIANLLKKNPDHQLSDLVNYFTLLDRLDNDNQQAQGVQLMTVHAAKGLEFPHVYIMGMEEGLLPHKNTLEDEGGIFEERRLAYVAVTRAQKTLSFTYAKQRTQAGEKVPQEPSRFLFDIESNILQWPSKPGTKIAKEENHKIAEANLDRLRALFSQ